MKSTSIDDIIDLDRYPIDSRDSEYRQLLLEEGRKALDDRALFSLPGFIRPQAIPDMVAELEEKIPAACRYDSPRIAYDYGQQSFPGDHPVNVVHPCSYYQVLNYQIPNDSSLRQVYYWQPLTDFLCEMLGYDSFFRSDCPHLALTSKIAVEGDTDGWHFDSNDVVFSILLQAPVEGGEFEYSPYIRSQDDQNFEGVSAVFTDPDEHAIRPGISPGDLTVFKGDLSLHRVTPVRGNRKRIVALFCYDQRPGMTFSEQYVQELRETLPEHQ